MNILLALLCAFFGGAASFGASVEATLDRSSISALESARLTITFRDVAPSETPRIPAVAGLAIHNRERGEQLTFINGQASRTVTFNFEVRPSQPGAYTIPSLSLNAGGAQYQTRPLQLSVTAAPAAGTNQLQMAFMRIIPPSRDIFVGEVVPIEIQLYYVAGRGEQIQHPQLKGEGFTIIKRQDPPGQSQTVIQGARFQVITFPMSISPAKAGELDLGPASLSMILRYGQASARRMNDPMDLSSVLDPLFGAFYERRQAEIIAPAVKLKVLPLPAGAPANFSGAIGRFSVSAEVTPTNATAGDPLSLRVLVQGSGSLDSLKLPPFNWNNLQVYPPNTRVQLDDALGLQGRKVFEFAVVAQNTAVKALPGISLSYLDPETKTYKTASTPAIPLTIAPSTNHSAVPATVASDASAPPPQQKDILHIKPGMGPLVSLAPAPLLPSWLLALQAAPIAIFLGALVWRKNRERLDRNPQLKRGHALQTLTRDSLAELQAAAADNRAGDFFSGLFRLLQEQIGHRLDRPAAGITEADLDQLASVGVSPELADRLRALFHACDEARYSRVSTPGALNAVLQQAERANQELNSPA